MAEIKVRVCDICGEEAVGVRRIDVCGAHSEGRTARRSANGRKTRAKAPLMKCAVCGKEVREGAGFSAHMRRAHPDQGTPASSDKGTSAKAPAK